MQYKIRVGLSMQLNLITFLAISFANQSSHEHVAFWSKIALDQLINYPGSQIKTASPQFPTYIYHHEDLLLQPPCPSFQPICVC